MQEYWAETVDDELNLVGQLAGATPHVFGLALYSDRQHVDVVIAADAPEEVLADVGTLRKRVMSERLSVGIRRSKHTLDDLLSGLRHVQAGDWARWEGETAGGPMAFGYEPKMDRIEVSLPSSAASAGARLKAQYPNLVAVTLDDGMGRA